MDLKWRLLAKTFEWQKNLASLPDSFSVRKCLWSGHFHLSWTQDSRLREVARMDFYKFSANASILRKWISATRCTFLNLLLAIQVSWSKWFTVCCLLRAEKFQSYDENSWGEALICRVLQFRWTIWVCAYCAYWWQVSLADSFQYILFLKKLFLGHSVWGL